MSSVNHLGDLVGEAEDGSEVPLVGAAVQQPGADSRTRLLTSNG
jgi:hypothetical protein